MEELSSKQREMLRNMAHNLKPIIFIGKNEITENLVNACLDNLRKYELIKIKIQQNVIDEKNNLAYELAEKCGAHIVRIIGKIIIMYKPNPEKEDRIKL